VFMFFSTKRAPPACHACTVNSLTTAVTPGADRAAPWAALRSASERTLPRRVTKEPLTTTSMCLASRSACIVLVEHDKDPALAIRVLAGEPEAAKSLGEEALPALEARFRERPDDLFATTALSWVYLALGRNADALRLSRQAADTISVEKDALAGPNFQIGLAQIEARAGAPEEAVKRLRRLLSIPAGGAASIAGLKMDPVWDPIRNRPDFQQLLSGPEQIGPNK